MLSFHAVTGGAAPLSM